MQFQSTLPRRERRRKPKQGTNHVNISIHAPAKGATHRIRDLQRKDRFQSTLPRRERHRLHLIKRSDMNFNPRSREGSDVAALAICDANTNFNPRSREGSDGKYLYGIRRQHHFNPRSREGSDDLRQMGQGRPCRFQSTLPRRERLPIGWSHPSWSNFNPRSREGSDESLQKSCRPATFQSTLPRRERRYLTLFLSAPCRFQSTLPRRERRRPVSYGGVFYVISIHAPAKGATDSAM